VIESDVVAKGDPPVQQPAGVTSFRQAVGVVHLGPRMIAVGAGKVACHLSQGPEFGYELLFVGGLEMAIDAGDIEVR
jgi:hypothetical protein